MITALDSKSHGGVSPDPRPFLQVSDEVRQKDMSKNFDPTVLHYWYFPIDSLLTSTLSGLSQSLNPCDELSYPFVECIVDSAKGQEDVDNSKALSKEGRNISVTFVNTNETKNVDLSLLYEMNCPMFERADDLSLLPYVNEATLFWNLKSRYLAKLSYTKCGLQCISMNPFKSYPIYSERTMLMYANNDEYYNEMSLPPHVYSLVHSVYQRVLVDADGKGSQCIIFTGQSGSGKSENVINCMKYLTFNSIRKANPVRDRAEGGVDRFRRRPSSLVNAIQVESKIESAYHLINSFGNAKTHCNDNSSRLHKYVSMYFDGFGKVMGCEVKCFGMELKRVTCQMEGERSFHIFYQLMHGMRVVDPELWTALDLSDDIYEYSCISHLGKSSKVCSFNDINQLELTLDSFVKLAFSTSEIHAIFRFLASILHLTKLDTCPELKPTICNLLDIDVDKFNSCFGRDFKKDTQESNACK